MDIRTHRQLTHSAPSGIPFSYAQATGKPFLTNHPMAFLPTGQLLAASSNTALEWMSAFASDDERLRRDSPRPPQSCGRRLEDFSS
jgi:hypothetical protein